MKYLYQTPTPIFFDPKGNRWRLFLVISILIAIFVGFIGYFFLRTQTVISSIDRSVRSLNYEAFAYERTLPKKSLLAFVDNEYESYYSIKENITNTAGIVLPWASFNSEGKVEFQPSELKNLKQSFLKQFKPSVNSFLQISDYNYSLQVPAEQNFLRFLETYTQEDIKNIGDYVANNSSVNFRGVVFNVNSSKWLKENFDKYIGFRNAIDAYLKEKNMVVFDSLYLNSKPEFLDAIKGRQNFAIINYWNNVFDVDEPLIDSVANLSALDSLIKNLGDTKFYLNFPTFSKDIRYTNEGVVNYEQKISFGKVYETIKTYSPEIKFDPKSGSNYLEYTDNDNIFHRVWFADSVSLFNQMMEVTSRFGDEVTEGYSFSNLGLEEQTVWDVIKSDTFNEKKSLIENKFKVDTLVESEGKGVVSSLVAESKFGKRTLALENNKITTQKWDVLPTRSKVKRTGFQEKSVALTFDDGPDPTYTPKILDILKQYNIKATFFVIGRQVIDHPEIAKRIINEGHTIENHTYSHTRLSNLQSITIDNEITSTDDIIAEILNVKTNYFRTPYNDIFGFNTESDLVVLNEVKKYNKPVVEEDIDSKDWLLKDKNAIESKVFSTIDTKGGSVILLHDGGGNRQATIESLPGIIEGINKRGYAIRTINEMVGAENQINQSAQNPDYQNQQISVSVSDFIMQVFGALLVLANIIGLIRYFTLMFLLGKKPKVQLSSLLDKTKGVSVIVPCFNEEVVIIQTIKSILSTNYPNLEVVVVDDGSTDKSLQNLHKVFDSNSQVSIFTKENAGKSIALNYGIRMSKHEFVICVDADTLFDKNAITELIKHFKDPDVGGVAGNVQIGNARSALTLSQQIEYSVAQNFDKQAYAVANSVIVVPGPIGAWRKPVILGAGGLHRDTLAEDTDLTLRVLQQGWKIIYEPNAVCYTECPETLPSFIKQRNRWQFGILQVIFKNWHLILNPRYGFTGLFTLPLMFLHYIFSSLYPFIIGGLVSYLGFYILTTINGGLQLSTRLFFENRLFIYFSLFYLTLDVVKIIIALAREKFVKNKWKLFFVIPYYLFVYQNIMSFISFFAIIRAIRGKIVGWGHLKRTGNVTLSKYNTQPS
jgi:peptidoglycan-N-acetylglucosamine deacetylase